MEFEFEKQAMRGEPCPKRLDIVDTCAYIALKNLYAMYRKGLISKKDATEEKKTIFYNWTTDKSKIDFLNTYSNELSEYIKNPTVKNATKICDTFQKMAGGENKANE